MHSTGRQARLQDLTACHHQRNPLRRQPRWQAHARTRHAGPTRAQQQSHQQVTAFAPATIANLGPGFDWLGCAVKGMGDRVTAKVVPGTPGTLSIEHITGDGGRLSLEPAKNCIGIAAQATLDMYKAAGHSVDVAISLSLAKGLPLGSGMGSSAASAAAACWAVNTLLGTRLTKQQCVLAGLKSEEAVSGYHADNIGPALLGGFTLIRSLKPLDIIEMTYPQPLHLVLVNPVYECPTAEMRAVLPETVPMQAAIHNSMMSGALTTAILQGNAKRLGECIDSDVIVEPVRAPFIPGFAAVKAAAKKAGAYGCTISGAGPTCVAVVGCSEEGQRVAQAMQDAFIHSGKLQVNSVHVTELDRLGTTLVDG